MRTLSALFALLLSASASAAPQVWVAPAAQKIRPAMSVPQGAPNAAVLAGAKNEFESFQVVVSGAATGVSMSLSGLSDSAGDSISGRDVVLYREALINVTTRSGGDGATGQWPDALVPDVDPLVGEKRNAFPFDVASGQSIAVFVDVHAPANTPAGVYTGVVHVTGGVAVDVPVSLTVWDFAVPSTSTLKSAYGLAWNGPCMGSGDGNCSNVAAQMALRARYVQAALDNHISLHQPYYTATINGSGAADWSAFDQYAGPFLDGTANTRLAGARLTSTSVNGASNAAQAQGWATHFAARGWSSALFDYVCDEPPATCAWSEITPRDNAVHAATPSVPTLVTTTAAQASAHGVSGIDLFTPVVNFVEGKPGADYAGNQRANYPATMWWYQSCMSYGCSAGGGETGWPTMAIDADATRNRSMEWLSYAYDVQGELYYETTFAYFGGDPWTNQLYFGGNGDGTLFYPGTAAKIGGKTEIPVESLRLKMIRDGMEDYELLHLATTLDLGAQALQIARGLYPKTYQTTTTPAALESARAQLAALILHALGKDTTPAPAPKPVPAPAADFSLAVTPAAQAVPQGQGATWQISVTPINGFAAAVAMTASGLPDGATAAFESTPAGAMMIVSAATTAAVGDYPLTISAVSGTLTHAAAATLTITAAPAPAPADAQPPPTTPTTVSQAGGGGCTSSAAPLWVSVFGLLLLLRRRRAAHSLACTAALTAARGCGASLSNNR